VLVESELDAIALDQAAGDLLGAVALGNSTAKPPAPLYALLKEALHLSISLDADEVRENKRTGRKESPGAAASKWWLEHFATARRVPCIGAKDPGEMVAAGADLRGWIMAGLPHAFLIRQRAQKTAPAAGLTSDKHERPAPSGKKPETLELDLETGDTVFITTSREKYQQLIRENKIAFSQNELERLQAATGSMDKTKKDRAVALVTDLKKTFGTAYIKSGRALGA